ncbi:MAG: lipoprotein insertase outer membrane protein LolB [Deefgea sp.]
MQIVKAFLTLGLLVLLSACAQKPLKPPSEGFAAQGRVNIRSQNDANTAMFDWLATPERDVLSLSTPLGTTLAELTIVYQQGDIVSASLKHGQATDVADDPESLLQNISGLTLPVSGMRWWLRGQPDARLPFTRSGESFTQSGWLVSATDFRGGALPYKIELTRDDLRVRVMISEWSSAAP